MAKDDYRLDLVTARPGELDGYFFSQPFKDWLAHLDNEDLLTVERAFNHASIVTGNLRFSRAHVENNRISQEALSHDFGGGKSASLRGL